MNERSASSCGSRTRCAIYTRKSTSEGLDQEFNSLDAQREAATAFVASQRHEGWIVADQRYDDGGYTGGNTDRPGLQRLMADIELGNIDCVVVYKVDRLSRSLRDFLLLMETFEKHGVMFVSVTQAFNTATSMGRLMLNVLLSFAQFEREMVSERTRDKMGAARRKGMWVGGRPVLGYDVEGTRLVINDSEAEMVRAIFQLYQDLGSLIPVVHELGQRGWSNKQWKGRGGRPFTKGALHRLLTNVTYAGKVLYDKQLFDGQHQPIIDTNTWRRTQSQLAENAQSGGASARNQFGALLKGLLYCAACNCAMTPTHSTKNKTRRYRYYRCVNSQQRGRQACPWPSIRAHDIEQVVLGQIRQIGSDPATVEEIWGYVRTQIERHTAALNAEQRVLARQLSQANTELHKLLAVGNVDATSAAADRLVEVQHAIHSREQRSAAIEREVAALQHSVPNQQWARQALTDFSPVWAGLTSREQRQLLGLLIDRVDFDGAQESVSITFHPTAPQIFTRPHGEHVA